jgi:uncharacterized protein
MPPRSPASAPTNHPNSAGADPSETIDRLTDSPEIDERALRQYVKRINERWALSQAWLGGARVDDASGLGPQRERGPEFVVVLISNEFGGVPWLERVYHAADLWDADTMGARVDVHCYTPDELNRKLDTVRFVRRATEHGLDLLTVLAIKPKPAKKKPAK